MPEFLRKSESHIDKIARINSIRLTKIYKFTLILFGVGVCFDVDVFKLTARAHSIYRAVDDRTIKNTT